METQRIVNLENKSWYPFLIDLLSKYIPAHCKEESETFLPTMDIVMAISAHGDLNEEDIDLKEMYEAMIGLGYKYIVRGYTLSWMLKKNSAR